MKKYNIGYFISYNDLFSTWLSKKNDFDISVAAMDYDFGNAVVFNDYEKFIQKVAYAIKSI